MRRLEIQVSEELHAGLVVLADGRPLAVVVRRALEAALADGAQSGRPASATARAGSTAPAQPRASESVPVGRGVLEERAAARRRGRPGKPFRPVPKS